MKARKGNVSKFRKMVKEVAVIFGMEDQEDDVAYALLELIVRRRLNWRIL